MSTILVCIHGWGGSKESFNDLRKALDGSGIEILTPDLPGFGLEPDPPRPWTNDDYADWVTEWIEHAQPATSNQQPATIHLLGHSHGGRIAIKLAHRQSTKNQKPAVRGPDGPSGPERETRNLTISHLYLCAAAGIPHPPTLKETLGLMAAKTGKTFLSIPGLRRLQSPARTILYKLLGVHDYERASPLMKETLKLVTDEDLTPLLRSINVPTDIFWGRNDTMTPFSDALIMEREIRGSTLHPFDNVRHRIHRDKAKEIAEVIRGRMNA
ncbi:MAG: alpha/beta hydrolase [Candidatus Peribacteraceae bacterium]|nr:alpha/beta hydrolase [Candidatus Peribacteraceae bacterium]